MTAQKNNSVFLGVYKIVKQIPKGKVFTYGAISKLISGRLTAQGVGWALNALPEKPKQSAKDTPEFHSGNVPWHRVINAKGQTSTSKRPDMPTDHQRVMLEGEGVKFDLDGVVDLKIYLWHGPKPKS